MDLALALGQPAEVLARTMTERELAKWHSYIRKRLLPTQRLELYLAQVAQIIALTMGGAKGAKITDYLIELQQPEPMPEVIDLDGIRRAFEYSPRKRKD